MERKMLALRLQDTIPYSEMRKRTKIIDIIEYILKQKWKWAWHIAISGPNTAQSGKQGEGRDQEDDHADDDKTT